jgi:hypothetical protein
MVEISQTFSRNIREGTAKVSFDPAELEGLPADFLANHQPGADGKIVLTTDYPDYFPVQSYAKREDTRKKLAMAFLNRGYPANQAALGTLLSLRSRVREAPRPVPELGRVHGRGQDGRRAAAAIEKLIADISRSSRGPGRRSEQEGAARP